MMIMMGKRIFFGGHEPHERRLDDGDERHIGVRRDGDGGKHMRSERLGEPDRRGAVRAADDADGRRLGAGETEAHREEERDVDAQLRSRAEDERFRVGKQRLEVRHRAHAEEDEAGIDAGLDADVEDVDETSVLQHVDVVNVLHRPPFGVEYPVARRGGKVAQEHTERDADKEQRLELAFDGEEEEHCRDQDHDHVAPLQIGKARGLPKEGESFAVVHVAPRRS